ncbi:MAG: hypothetical protein SNF86_06735 [Rikenellaceae bacterium]
MTQYARINADEVLETTVANSETMQEILAHDGFLPYTTTEQPTTELDTLQSWGQEYEVTADAITLKWVVKEPALEEAIEYQVALLNEYDSKDFTEGGVVNVFYLGDVPMWFAKDVRLGLRANINDAKTLGLASVTWNVLGTPIELPVDQADLALATIESVYAVACYNNTQQHESNIRSLTTAAMVLSYDYTTGYPEHIKIAV